jgi:2-polyprenyl-3-methyl-5-hydroxy-6-metoxy-1,4-benzoquinol methylase
MSSDVGMNEAISREWDEASESWADFVRLGKDYYREEMNNPATFKLIGNIQNQRILDLSCGEGYNTRILARKGGIVLGVDLSEQLIKLARLRENEDRLGINYYVSDAADLTEFENEYFDVVTCFMALMDIEHYEDAISEVARVLKKNGRFIFSIPHPCFEFGLSVNGEFLADWKYEEGTDNSTEKKATHLEIRRYFGIIKSQIKWNNERLIKPFTTTSFHRTLTNYFHALYENKFLIVRLVEPKPTLKGVRRYPSLSKHTLIPHSIIIEAITR